MTSPGIRAVRDALLGKLVDLEHALFAQAVVTAVDAGTVSVLFPGAATAQTWPRLNASVTVAVGDVVVMAGRSGSWTCLGTISGTRDVAGQDLSGENLTVTDTAHIGLLYVNGITCYFALSADTLTANGVTVNGVLTSGRHNMGANPLYCGDIHQEGHGLFTAGIINTGRTTSAGFTDTTASRRAFKRNLHERRGSLQVLRDAPIYDYQLREDAPPVVEGSEDAETWRAGPLVDDLPADATTAGLYSEVPEFGGMLRHAWQAIREQDAVITTLTAKVVELERRLDQVATT